MPGGMFSHTMVTSVPPSTTSNVTTIVISPEKAGSGELKVIARRFGLGVQVYDAARI
jgi:hypothetical protein